MVNMSESPYQLAEAGEEEISESMEVARLRHRQGDLEAAQELCHGIMERDPTNPEVYYQLGIIALIREALEMAHHYFCLASHLDPETIAPGFGNPQAPGYEGHNLSHPDLSS